MTDKEKQLQDLLLDFEHSEADNSMVPDQFRNSVAMIMIAARENGWVDEFIRIAKSNKGKTFSELERQIFTKERFPPLEIVDDEEE